jgi:hypothetical protein
MSDLSNVVGAAVGAANPVTALVSLGQDLIDRFIPDPAVKAQAAQALQEQQTSLLMAQLNQQTDLAKQAGQNIQNDKLAGPRSVFCYAVVALLVWNYGICRFFHQAPVDFPLSLIAAFTALMLGQAGINMAQSVAAMPGESQVSVLGVKVGNKS